MTTFPQEQEPRGPHDRPHDGPGGEPTTGGEDALSGPAAFGLPGDPYGDPYDDPYGDPEDAPQQAPGPGWGATQPVPTQPVPTQPVPTQPVPTQPGPPPWAAPPTAGVPPVPGTPRPGTPYPSYGIGVPTGVGGGSPGDGPVRPARPGAVGAVVAAVVVLLLLVVAGVAVTALRRSGPEPTTALPTATTPFSPRTLPPTTSPGATDGTSPSSPAPSSPAPSSSVPPSGGPRTTATPPPVAASRPGWTAVAGRELVAYDVPPGWKALPSGTLTGFETSGGPKQLVIMHNAAAYEDDICPKASSSSRGQAGFVAWKGQSPSTVAQQVSRQWATVAGTQDDGSVMPLSSTVESRTSVAGGTIPATVATTTVTLQDQPSCAAERIDFTAVSFQVRGQPVIFMLYLDRGVAGEVSTADRDAIIASLRPV